MAQHKRDLKRELSWRRHIAEQRTSGQTVRAYCESHQLRETAFYFWRQEIAKRDREAAADAKAVPAFVPVAVIDTPIGRNAPIDVRLAGGHRVRIRSGCDRALLADVIGTRRRRAGHADVAAFNPCVRRDQARRMRRSFDGLLAIVRDFLGHEDPLSGHLFAFRNKSGDRLKVMWWDRDGLAIFYKRLEDGGFPFPLPAGDAKEIEMTAADLQLVLQEMGSTTNLGRVRKQNHRHYAPMCQTPASRRRRSKCDDPRSGDCTPPPRSRIEEFLHNDPAAIQGAY
jgi:transposase